MFDLPNVDNFSIVDIFAKVDKFFTSLQKCKTNTILPNTSQIWTRLTFFKTIKVYNLGKNVIDFAMCTWKKKRIQIIQRLNILHKFTHATQVYKTFHV